MNAAKILKWMALGVWIFGGEATPIIFGNSYQIEFPVFGYKVVEFETRSRE